LELAACGDRIVVDVDHAIEHRHSDAHRLASFSKSKWRLAIRIDVTCARG
jgi:hypothetical protein